MENIKEYWVDLTTGELVLTKVEAMNLYRQGHEIAYWSWSNVFNEMIHRVDWVH